MIGSKNIIIPLFFLSSKKKKKTNKSNTQFTKQLCKIPFYFTDPPYNPPNVNVIKM